MQKSKTNATNVTIPLLRHGVWRIIWKCTVEKSQTNATYATLHPLIKAIWGNLGKRTVEKSKTNATNVTIPPLNLKIWRLTSSLTLHYDASPIENGKLRNLPKWLPHPPFLEDMNCFRLNIYTQQLVSFTFWHIFGPSWSFREGKHFW